MVSQAADAPRTVRRLTLALALSLALHTLLLTFNRPAAPKPQAAPAALALVAHLSPARLTPQPTPQAQTAPSMPSPARQPVQTAQPIPHPSPQATTTAAPLPNIPATASPNAAEPPAAPPPTNDTNYYPVESLDSTPKLLTKMQQIYPPRARSAEIEGSVTLEILINERGEIEHASIAHAQPRGYFEEAALTMLRGQRYSPPMKNGRPVRSRYLFTVRYKLDD